MSKLSFRARALDPSKPMPIYLAEELPDLPEYSAINRAVPQMPSGMEKEEESEHHLQRAICAGLLIPTPEVTNIEDEAFYDRVYPATYKMPRQLIHMQPLGMDQDIPDYDMDSSDETFVEQQAQRLDLDVLKFEQMMDKLEKSSGQTVVTLNEAKALLKQDDEVSIAVYDYWLNKRLKTVHPLILNVKTENRGNMAPNDPYLAFRRRTEKMQTRKNRKNDETSYEKMLKLRRDLSRAVSLLEIVKRRETTKRANVQATVDIFEKRFAIKDFSGQIAAEIAASMARNSRPDCAPIYSNQYHHGSPLSSWTSSHQRNAVHHYNSTSYGSSMKQYHHHHHLGDGSGGGGLSVNSSSRKEKRQYKKRKHKLQQQKEKSNTQLLSGGTGGYASGASSHHSLHHPHAGSGIIEPMMSSDEDDFNGNNAPGSESEDEGLYSFKRNRNCNYHKPISEGYGNWPWVGKDENGKADKKYRFTLTSIRHPRPRCIGFARRRMGRGGRIALDRCSTSMDEIWSNLDYTIFDSEKKPTTIEQPSSVVMDRVPEIPFPQLTTHLSQLTAGRVTSVRLSSATSDGTASPLSYATPTQRVNSLSVISQTSEIMPVAQASTSMTSEVTIKEEHLDDYERLIDSMRNNNKAAATVHGSGISSGSNLVGSSSSNLRHLHTPPAAMVGRGTFSGEFECVVKQEPRLSTDQPPMSQTESRDSGISVKSDTPAATDTPMTDLTGEVDIDEFLHDVERNWSHFRPKTPVTPPSITSVDEFTGDFAAEQDAMTRLLSPFNVEMQCLDTLPQNLFADNEECTFVTAEPLALDTLLADDPTRSTNQDGKENPEEVNTSGDGFNDFSLGDANDKLVANILEDMENSKTLSQTSTFFNHLLDGNVPSPEPNESEPKSEETIGGYISELVHSFRCLKNCVTTTDPSLSKHCDCVLCQSNRMSHSHFKVTSQPAVITKRLLKASAAAAADRTVIKQEEEEVKDTLVQAPVIFPAITTTASTNTITGVKIKSEPHDELTCVPTTTGIVFVQHQTPQTQISSADATASHDYAAQPHQQLPQQQQQQQHHHHQFVQIIGQTATAIRTPQQKMQTFTTGDATAVFPTTTLRQMNGPVLQNLLRYQPQKSQKHDDGQLIADNTKIKHLVKSDSNHNPTQSSMQQQQFGILHPNAQIAIIGSAQSSQGGPNRIFLASQPSTSTVDGKLHITTAGGGQSQISTLTSIPSAALVMDSNAAGKGHGGTTVVDSKSGQRVKLETRFFDTSKQQFLYATNFKNNRGGQLLTSKVVNIVPIHSGKNSLITAAAAASSGQTPTTATVLRNKAASDIIQRVGTINNAQNIRPSNNGGNKVISMVTTAAPASDNTKLLATDNSVPGINTTTR